MKQTILDNVRLAPAARETVGFGRNGTALVTIAALTELLGEPQSCGDEDKVTAEWWLDTPRGPVLIHDYWWNRSDEMSFNGNRRASMWAAAWFRAQGITASCTYWHWLMETHKHGYASIQAPPYFSTVSEGRVAP